MRAEAGESSRFEVGGAVSIAILAGGKSRRMGQDKALLPFPPGGPLLLERVIRAATGLSDDLFVVATDRPDYARFGVPVIPDRWPGQGPLGGIGTALSVCKHERCLVLSCDHPFLQPGLLRWLIEREFVAEALIPGTGDQGDEQWHPLLAVYGRGCLGAIENALSRNQLRVVDLFRQIAVEAVSEAELRTVDPALRSLVNVNTPEALAAALAMDSHENDEV